MRALLSVYDKTGVADLARGLAELGWELISSGGTARAIAEAGIEVTDLADFTGYPPMLGHRVVTLHPLVHGAILADPADPEHQADIEAHGIKPVDLVVANLYPFGSDPADFQHGGGRGEDLIDIGGPAMVRAAAKNHAHVAVVVDPADYDTVLEEARRGGITGDTRRALARKAFATTAAYDAAVAGWLDATIGGEAGERPEAADNSDLPDTLELTLERAQDLRYGENPHQQGARYRFAGARSWWDDATIHQGRELSYLNLYDTEAAWRLVHDLGEEPGVAIIKHANPSGVAIADDVIRAYEQARACDEQSAFGGIVAVNRPVPGDLAEKIIEIFTEVVIAPAFEPDALAVFATRENIRVIEARPPSPLDLTFRSIDGGMLVQQADRTLIDRSAWQVVTKATPTAEQWRDIELAWRVSGHVKSNSIVLVKDGVAWGIGAGQQKRVDSARIAAEKAAGRAAGGACASEALIPFRDGVDAAAEAGVATFVQTGGSVRDEEVIAAADEHGIAMIFTGERHFLH